MQKQFQTKIHPEIHPKQQILSFHPSFLQNAEIIKSVQLWSDQEGGVWINEKEK